MKLLKVILDRTVALVSLIILSPLLLAIALLVRQKLGSPVFFVQKRPGKGGKIFHLIKFRTMKNATNEKGEPLPDSLRMTPFGSFLRSSSLDELPELWNVLKGEMSLVGPRPLLVQYLERYSPEQARRHEVLPGLTGLAQVSGRNAISWEEKFRLDVWYIDNWSLWLDFTILIKTLGKVLRRSDIAAADSVTMKEFLGAGDAGKS